MLMISRDLIKKDDLKEITQNIINGFQIPPDIDDQLKDEKFCAGIMCAMQLCLTSDHHTDSSHKQFNSLVILIIDKILKIHGKKLQVEVEQVPERKN